MQKCLLLSPRTPEEFKSYYNFRWQQLRQPLNLPPGSEQDDYEADAYHCMAMSPDHKILGVGRINLHAPRVMRIRYMAIDKNVQGRGVGSAILNRLLDYAKTQDAELCWLNARQQACGFYQQHKFAIVGKAETDLQIPHFRMEKYIK